MIMRKACDELARNDSDNADLMREHYHGVFNSTEAHVTTSVPRQPPTKSSKSFSHSPTIKCLGSHRSLPRPSKPYHRKL
jgi:hypothetical protein